MARDLYRQANGEDFHPLFVVEHNIDRFAEAIGAQKRGYARWGPDGQLVFHNEPDR